ncbi:MAG: D-alanyl-D-alanine carboxypeptidase [Bdellovibrionaceae bacterium]|nr:D-alanyl-D-alanine carboxypeptidase [Pseudobdellovibrionaceae bacterium]|tara:strand:- start:199069 stop:200118 length:1050 start_codon:yes stop_codon:yes gene_type:complete
MQSVEKRIKDRVDREFPSVIRDLAPSIQVSAILKGKKRVDLRWGEERRYFDLASLTKIIFTVSAYMREHSYFDLKPQDIVHDVLPEINEEEVKFFELLSHSAGYVDWKPYFKKLRSLPKKDRWYELRRMVLCEKRQSHRKNAVYSDLDFILLGFALEQLRGRSLIGCWNELRNDFPKTRLHFCKDNRPKYVKSYYAPTEKCSWRKQRLQGEVHDDNTWSWGGVSSHAGLFGRLEDVEDWALSLRKALNGQSSWVKPDTVKLFTKRALPKKNGDWSLGFMMPGSSPSCGSYFSSQSFGHLGFTGTSFWMDPKKDLMITLLTNRVYYGRKRSLIKEARPLIHNIIFEELMR